MASCNRIAKVLHGLYPHLSVEKITRHIKSYRLDRDTGQPDWENMRGFFHRVLKMAFKRRHLVLKGKSC